MPRSQVLLSHSVRSSEARLSGQVHMESPRWQYH